MAVIYAIGLNIEQGPGGDLTARKKGSLEAMQAWIGKNVGSQTYSFAAGAYSIAKQQADLTFLDFDNTPRAGAIYKVADL